MAIRAKKIPKKELSEASHRKRNPGRSGTV